MSLGDFGRDMLAEAARIAQQTVVREGTHLRWATVTDTEPLRIRYDGEPNPSIVTPQNTVAGLAIGDRVAVGKQHGQALIVGRAGGVTEFDAGMITSGTLDPGRRWAGAPFAEAAGLVPITMSGTSALQTVVFPAGRFTVPPVLTFGRSHNGASGAAGIPAANPVSVDATKAVIGVYGNYTGTVTVWWRAVQMTPTSASG